MDWKRILIGKWSWKRPLYSLGSIYILLAITACSLGDKLIFQPPPSSYTAELDGLVMIGTEEGSRIAIVHMKAPPGAPTLLYSHGNAEDIGQNIDIFREWHARGLGVIAYDYPGYGLSPGSASEKTTQQAIKSAWEYALASGIKPSSIVIVGRSIGTGPSVWLASSAQPAGLILISPLKSAYTVAIPTPFPIFPGDRFPNLDLIKKINTPLVVIHGEDDNVIPFSHGVAIFENSPTTEKAFLPIPSAGHNDLFTVGGTEIFAAIEVFAKRVGK